MTTREFLDVDPIRLHLPNSRRFGPDARKLQRQIATYGTSTVGLPPLLVYRGIQGALLISDGVTRATRIAKLLPGTVVRVEVLGDLPITFDHLPTIGELP